MSLIPHMCNDLWAPNRPSRIMDQHFGLGLDPVDFLEPLTQPFGALSLVRHPSHYYRPWRSLAAQNDVGSTIKVDKDKFMVTLDVQHFAPEEITVKVTGKNTITVEGKHEEKPDDHGFVSRHFVRRYVLPEGHDVNNIASNLSSDGVLSICAPKIDQSLEEHRTIPIQQTGVPMKSVEAKKDTAKAGDK